MRDPLVILGCLLMLETLGAGCTNRKATAEVGPLPVAPTAYPTGPASVGPGVAEISEDIQPLTIRIDDGEFAADVYDMQSRSARIEVWSSGGPYTLAIDGLLNPRRLDADGATVIGLTPPVPGRFTMRLSGASKDTATLNLRPPGER
jgi:hypothetical protein